MSSVSATNSGSTNGIPNPITVSTGFNSGLPIDDIITKLMAVDQQPVINLQNQEASIKNQQSLYSTAQTYVQSLLSNIEKLTNRDVATGASIFDNKTATSNNTAIVTATTDNTAASQNITLEVKKLPSLTTATSTAGVGAFDANTTVDQLGITAGNFTVYANGVPYTVGVAPGETIGAVLSAINANVPDTAISADPTVSDGKINLTYATGQQIVLGSGADSTNFLAITHMLTGVNTDNGVTGSIVASQRNSTLDRNQLLSAPAAHIASPITDGTFTINGVSFNTTGKTMNDIIDSINTSTANVSATFNSGNNTFQLTSKNTGSTYIAMADGTSNFLTSMNLISPASVTASQTLGQNAQFVLNGTTMYAATTTVDQSVTGLTGVTLNLNQASPGTQVQITVQPDTASVVTAVQNVIASYNTAITFIDKQTNAQNNMPLAGESGLKNLRNQVRSMFTAAVSGLSSTPYDSLQQIGISTGAVGSTAGQATPQLVFDSTKLTAALAADPATVKKLFIAQNLGGAQNNTAQDDNMDGVFTQLQHLLSDTTYTDSSGNSAYGALYAGTGTNNQGLFAAFQTSSANRITQLDKNITDMQARLTQKQTDLRNQYLAMDKLVGQYQSQGNALTGLINQLNGSSTKA